MHGVAVVGLGKIEHNAALAAVEEWKKRDAHSAERACLVACWWLDLDHLRTQLRQDHAACRTHDHVGHFDHPHAFKRHSGFGHGALPLLVSRDLIIRQLPKRYNISKRSFIVRERISALRAWAVPGKMCD